MSKYSVSVIVTTYNPDWEKLLCILKSIIIQEDITFEVIVTDDGSKIDHFEEIKIFFNKNKFKNIKFIKNKTNIGTVKNYYNALMLASGKYTYGISPGDMLYNKYTLCNLYQYSNNNNIDICFGDAIYYELSDGQIIIKYITNIPCRPWMYDEKVKLEDQKLYFLIDNCIAGPSFFRKTEIARKYIGCIKNISKYVEDNTSTAFALADGVRIYHYNSYVVWYEQGCGLSTSKKKEWHDVLMKDFQACFEKLRLEYSNDRIISVYTRVCPYNKILKAILLMFFSPRLFIKILRYKFSPVSIGYNKSFEINFLKQYLGGRYL